MNVDRAFLTEFQEDFFGFFNVYLCTDLSVGEQFALRVRGLGLDYF